MGKKLGIVTVHGMGRTYGPDNPDSRGEFYASGLLEQVAKRLSGHQSSAIEWGFVYYQNLLQDNQDRYYGAIKDKVHWDALRAFMIHGFCDAATLESQKYGSWSPYFLAQSNILRTFREVFAALEPGAPLFIIAQSLGGQVISNYLWDAGKVSATPSFGVWQNPPVFESPEEEAFSRGFHLKRLFTTGCNIPLFVAGRAEDQIYPITPRRDDFEWHNFFDRADVLGYPLQDLSTWSPEGKYPSYNALVRDHAIRVGWLGGLDPRSHTGYWEDSSFVSPLVDAIRAEL